MSYVTTNFYQNPGPYYGTSDKGEPVPGWGPLPVMAGGARVGYGQVLAQHARGDALTVVEQPQANGGKAGAAWSRYALVAGLGLLGTGLYLRYRKKR